MITLDAVPGSLTMNSFVSLEEANVILSQQLFTENDWDLADNETKKKGLITATNLITSYVAVNWLGWPLTFTQPLPFPRGGLYNRVGGLINGVPFELKQATAEYARQLIATGEMPDTPAGTEGVQAFTAGPVSFTFRGEDRPKRFELPESVYGMISFLMLGSRMNHPVYRT